MDAKPLKKCSAQLASSSSNIKLPDGPPPYATVATGSKYRLRRGSATKPRANMETRKIATVRPICADVLLIQLLHVNRCS